jgi:hypothetical protein
MAKKRPSALGLENLLPIEGPGRADLMQLYAWDFDDALKADKKWRSRYGPNIQGRGPLFRWAGAQELKEIYELYRARNPAAIIEALFVCSLNSLPIPRWCELSYLAAYRRVRQYKAKSWDDVFGRPHQKGKNLGAKEKEREYSLQVYYRIEDIKRKDPSVATDGALFERVGKEFGIGGKTLTEEYYYKEKRRHRSPTDSFKPK